MARAKDRRCALVVLGASRAAWPLPPDLELEIERARWEGAGEGEGRLARRLVEVRIEARGVPTARRARLWLPSEQGDVAALTKGT